MKAKQLAEKAKGKAKEKQIPLTISDLKPSPTNPRGITPESMEGLKTSVTEFGDLSGIVWNKRSGHLVAGHQRMEALKGVHGDGLTMTDGVIVTPAGDRFPVRVVDWDAKTERAANIAANSALVAGVFIPEMLNVQLEELVLDYPSFEALRFDELKIDTEEETPEITKESSPKAPPELVWVLLGVPTNRYVEIASLVEEVGFIEDAVVETTIS